MTKVTRAQIDDTLDQIKEFNEKEKDWMIVMLSVLLIYPTTTQEDIKSVLTKEEIEFMEKTVKKMDLE